MELSLHSQVDSSIIRFNSGKHWHFLKQCASGSMTFLSLPVLTYSHTHFTNSTSIFQTFSQITTVLQPQLWFCIELLMLSSKLRSTWNIIFLEKIAFGESLHKLLKEDTILYCQVLRPSWPCFHAVITRPCTTSAITKVGYNLQGHWILHNRSASQNCWCLQISDQLMSN